MKRTRTRTTSRTTTPRPPRWTAQTMFTASATHLLGMTEKAEVEGTCRYRTPNGNRCAIGILIPDALYRASFERTALFNLEEEKVRPIRKAAGITRKLRSLALALQHVHDAHQITKWPVELTKVAELYHVHMPEVATL